MSAASNNSQQRTQPFQVRMNFYLRIATFSPPTMHRIPAPHGCVEAKVPGNLLLLFYRQRLAAGIFKAQDFARGTSNSLLWYIAHCRVHFTSSLVWLYPPCPPAWRSTCTTPFICISFRSFTSLEMISCATVNWIVKGVPMSLLCQINQVRDTFIFYSYLVMRLHYCGVHPFAKFDLAHYFAGEVPHLVT